jgi:ATP-binding cassette, subfamily B, bacterial HlyB/CyaB
LWHLARRRTDPSSTVFTQEQALWLLSSGCALHRLAFDSSLFVQRYPGEHTVATLAKAAEELGLDVQIRALGFAQALAWHLPVVVLLNDASDASAAAHWALVLNADEERVSLLEPGATAPEVHPVAVLAARYQGLSLALMPQQVDAFDPDNIEPHAARFGLRWFLPELLKHKKIWREVLAASLVMQLMGLALPLFTQVIIDKVVVHRTRSTLVALAIAMAVFVVFTTVLSWIRQYLILHTGRRIDAVLGSQVLEKLFRLPLLYFQHRPTGVIAARMQGIETIREFIASAAVTALLDVPFLLIFVAIMFWYSVPLTLLVLGVLAVVTTLSLMVSPLFRNLLNEQFRRGAAAQAFVTEYVAGVETVKSLQFEPQLNVRYRGLLAKYLKSTFATRQLANNYGSWTGALEQLMTSGILLLGAYIVMTGSSLTIGMLVAFQMFAARVSQPMMRLVGLWQQWQQTRISIARLGDIMNAPAEHYSLRPRRAQTNGPGVVQIEGLSFRFAKDLPLLYDGFNLDLPAGQVTAVTGASGVGKSTLAKLLQGFYVPGSGRIRIDGVDINALSANELRATFGVVPQETVLFSGTILENLKLAQPFASFEQVVAACRMAEIHSTIEALPQGYETPVGERGVGLSGGQRQRLAIARALLKGPKVLIFDEATSSLDPPTAEQVGRTISSLKGRVTILFIAHAIPKSLQVDRTVRLGEKLAVIQGDRSEAQP